MQHLCPTCIGTMLPGVTYTFPRDYSKLVRSPGKLWYPYTGAATAQPHTMTLGDCYRCHGSGVVEDRRGTVADRRLKGNCGRRENDCD